MAGFNRRRFLGMAGASTLGLGGRASEPRPSRAKPAPPLIKIGQVGTGHAHAAGKMSTLRKLADHFQVAGVVEPDPRRRRAAAGNPAYRDLPWLSEEQLFNTPGLAAVAVETDVERLVPTAQRCIAAGLHIHLDKPAGPSLGAFRSLLAEADRGGRVIQMGYMFRGNPAFRFCHRAVREGWLGEVFEIHGVISKAIGPSRRRPLARYPGGSMFELGCHLIDALIWLMGPPRRVWPFLRRTRPDLDQLADNCLAVFEYPKATATIRSALIEVEGVRRRQLVVCGDRGTIDIRPLEPPHLQLAFAEPRAGYQRGYQEVDLPPMPGRYDEQLMDLARIIRGEKENDFPTAHDLAVHRAVLEASDMAG